MGRKGRALVAAVIAAAAVGMAVQPGGAADTDTEFTITGGNLAISAPGAKDLGSIPSSSLVQLVSGNLGTVTVTDTRNILVANWTASVSSTDFTTGTATANETVAASNVVYLSGLQTAGSVGFVPTVASFALGSSGTAGLFVGSGNNTASWDPLITITVPGGKYAGEYHGTITHSVA